MNQDPNLPESSSDKSPSSKDHKRYMPQKEEDGQLAGASESVVPEGKVVAKEVDAQNIEPAMESPAEVPAQIYAPPSPELMEMQESLQLILKEGRKALVGQESILRYMYIALLSGGHCLLEGLPGIAKTMTVRVLSKTLSADFSRIQFTPDLLPTDITGTSIYNLQASEFNFKKGPIFSNLVLIDEINRAPAKTQAALMEVMEEQQITFDGEEYKMDAPFMVLATQNPIEQEGTYALPEAQQDRFMFKIKLLHPNLEVEKKILQMYRNDFGNTLEKDVNPVVSSEQIEKYSKAASQIHTSDDIINYIAEIVHKTRHTSDLYLGASPRASRAILKASKVAAGLSGRDFVIPDDVKDMCKPVLNHRIILSHEREMEGLTTEEVIDALVKEVEIPR